MKKKSDTNVGAKLIGQIQEKFDLAQLPAHYLDFSILPSQDIARILELRLQYQPKAPKYDTYWDYRLATKPSNCLTCDIDALEVGKNSFLFIEAAQLFNTNKNHQLDEVARHIFRTFIRRKNRVNPFQYVVQDIIAQKLNSPSFILFHKINQNILDETSPALLLRNDSHFHGMLFDIANPQSYATHDEAKFLNCYRDYLEANLVQYDSISKLYQSTGIIY